MPDEIDNDSSQNIVVKDVQILEAGGLTRNSSGAPACFMQVAAQGEIEPLMIMTPWDAKRLTLLLLVALNTLGDEWANGVVQGHLVARDDDGDPDWHEHGDPGVGPWPARQVLTTAKLNEVAANRDRLRTKRKPSKVRVVYQPSSRNRQRTLSAAVFAAYQNGKVTVLLTRQRTKVGTLDRLLRVECWNSKGYAYFADPEERVPSKEQIAPEAWDSFLALEDGTTVMIDGKYWAKVSVSALGHLARQTLKPRPW